MLSNQVIQDCVDDISNIMGASLHLYGTDEELVAGAGERPQGIEDVLGAFVSSMADSQQMKGYHFFKIYEEEDVEYLLVAGPDTIAGYNAGKLAQSQLVRLMEAYREKNSANTFMQNLLAGNVEEEEVFRQARQLEIVLQVPRAVFLVDVQEEQAEAVEELVRALYGRNGHDFIVEVGAGCLALVKELSGETHAEEMEDIANTLVDMINAETMSRVCVSYGNPAMELCQVVRSCREARLALEVGRIFYREKPVMAYSMLGIGRLIYQLPADLCDMFLQEVFGGEVPKELDEETLTTINTFFDMNLNMAETARQLYMHRNTLAYRLEKIQKITGLDIRSFEDAMTLKLALMVADYRRMNISGND